MMREIFPFLTAAGLLLILAFTAILLVRKRMQRGEIVQAVVKKAEINDSDPNGSTLVTLTYCFSWEGRTLEIQQKPQYGICRPVKGNARHCAGMPKADGCANFLPDVLWLCQSCFMPLVFLSLYLRAVLPLFSAAGSALSFQPRFWNFSASSLL